MLRPHGLQHAMLPVSWSLLKFMSIESEMLSNHLILCPHPLLSPSPFAFSLSQHQGHFQWVSSFPLSQVAKVLELQFQHYPSNEYSGLISFRIDWFGLLGPLYKKMFLLFRDECQFFYFLKIIFYCFYFWEIIPSPATGDCFYLFI